MMPSLVPVPPGLEADAEPKLDGVADALDHFSTTVQSSNTSEASFLPTGLCSSASDSLEQVDPAAPPSMTAGWLQNCQNKEHLLQMQLRQMLAQQQMQMPPMSQMQIPEPQCGIGSSGEWVNAVLSTAPYLDAEGTKEALAILDKAVNNLQQIKALDGIIASTYLAGGIFTAMPHLHAAEHMKAQVIENQQMLLRQLYHMRAAATPGGAAETLDHSSGLNFQGLQQRGSASTQPRGEQSLQAFMQQPQQQHDPMIFQLPQQRMPLLPELLAQCQQTSEAPCSEFSAEQSEMRRNGEQHGGVQTLSSSLQLLADEDPACLFIVRRINKLGFKASKKLKNYFSGCGTVVRVLVAHSTVRPPSHYWDRQNWPRRRPSSLGFVQMATPEAAQRVLAFGQAQKVENCVILVQRFERQGTDSIQEEDEDARDEEEDVLEDLACKDSMSNRQPLSKKSLRMNADDWKRQQQSTFSTSTRSTSIGGTRTGSAGGSGSANGSAGSAKGSGSAYADSAFEGSPLEENTSAEAEEGSSEPKDGSQEVEECSAEAEEGSSDLKEGSADGGEGSSEPKDGSADAEDQGSA